MESVPGAIATGSQLIARIEIARMVTRSLPLPVLTSFSKSAGLELRICVDLRQKPDKFGV